MSSKSLYFADVDRRDYKLTTFDVEKNEILIKENINQMQEWAQSNKLDFIKVLEDLNLKEPVVTNPEAVTLRIRYTYRACANGLRGVYRARYFLGIRISAVTQVMVTNERDHLVQAQVGCYEEYNPR